MAQNLAEKEAHLAEQLSYKESQHQLQIWINKSIDYGKMHVDLYGTIGLKMGTPEKTILKRCDQIQKQVDNEEARVVRVVDNKEKKVDATRFLVLKDACKILSNTTCRAAFDEQFKLKDEAMRKEAQEKYSTKEKQKKAQKNHLRFKEYILLFALLLVIVVPGALRRLLFREYSYHFHRDGGRSL